MKNNIIKTTLAFTALLLLLVTGCKKEDQYPSKTVKVTYPAINLKGDQVVILHTGDSYSDAGATLVDDITGASSDIEAIDNPVDPSTPGVYMVTFTAKNANGFETVKQRPVVVTDIDDSWDLTGVYARTANGVEVNVTKIGRGVYIIDNVGGVAASSPQFIFPVYMAQLDDATIEVPAQYIDDGTVLDCVDETLTAQPGDTSFSYIVDNPSFGTSTRTFVKQ